MANLQNQNQETIILLDFGAQYSHLVARCIRSLNVYCEIMPFNSPIDKIRAKNPRGIILTGGPASVLEPNAPKCAAEVFELGVPVWGIGYGMQLMALMLGGEVALPGRPASGKLEISIAAEDALLQGIAAKITAWTSTALQVIKVPAGFTVTAQGPNIEPAAFSDQARRFYGSQFHPEAAATPDGLQVFRNFLFTICGCSGSWQMESYLTMAVQDIREQVGNKQVLLGLSGGVDSSVVGALVHRAIGEQLTAVFVNHGLLRKNEFAEVVDVFRPLMGDKLIAVDASARFLAKLKGINDPEQKRKIIGAEFIAVFSETARQLGKLDFLAQGTIYPDVVESGEVGGKVIKSHHNVGGLPKDLPFCGLVEPLRYLFKDEVRLLGQELGLPNKVVLRPPFPGPGLAIRIIGEVTAEKLTIVREADAIVRQEIDAAGLPPAFGQYFAVLTNLRSVGVTGNERSYDYTVAVRCVSSEDFMSADWVRLDYQVLENISRRITAEVQHVNRVVYDITSKPPSSIEWE